MKIKNTSTSCLFICFIILGSPIIGFVTMMGINYLAPKANALDIVLSSYLIVGLFAAIIVLIFYKHIIECEI